MTRLPCLHTESALAAVGYRPVLATLRAGRRPGWGSGAREARGPYPQGARDVGSRICLVRLSPVSHRSLCFGAALWRKSVYVYQPIALVGAQGWPRKTLGLSV